MKTLFTRLGGLILLVLAALVVTTGCANKAIVQGDIVAFKERCFGIVVAQSAVNQSPEVKLGFTSTVVQCVPTSTNAVVNAPAYVDKFDLEQGINPFGTAIRENSATGPVNTTNNTNDASSAIVPK